MHCLRRIVVSKPVRVTSWTDDVDFGVLCFLTRYVSLRKALRAIQQDARRSRRSFAEVALATPTVTKQALAVQDLDNLGVNLPGLLRENLFIERTSPLASTKPSTRKPARLAII